MKKTLKIGWKVVEWAFTALVIVCVVVYYTSDNGDRAQIKLSTGVDNLKDYGINPGIYHHQYGDQRYYLKISDTGEATMLVPSTSTSSSIDDALEFFTFDLGVKENPDHTLEDEYGVYELYIRKDQVTVTVSGDSLSSDKEDALNIMSPMDDFIVMYMDSDLAYSLDKAFRDMCIASGCNYNAIVAGYMYANEWVSLTDAFGMDNNGYSYWERLSIAY